MRPGGLVLTPRTFIVGPERRFLDRHTVASPEHFLFSTPPIPGVLRSRQLIPVHSPPIPLSLTHLTMRSLVPSVAPLASLGTSSTVNVNVMTLF